MDDMTNEERAMFARYEAEMDSGPAADTGTTASQPLLDTLIQRTTRRVEVDLSGQVPVVRPMGRPVQQPIQRPTDRLDHGGTGFPPIDPPEPTYGGRRPGRGGPRDLSPWALTFMVWAATAAAYVVDAPEQRDADRPFMLLVLVAGSIGAHLVGRRR